MAAREPRRQRREKGTPARPSADLPALPTAPHQLVLLSAAGPPGEPSRLAAEALVAALDYLSKGGHSFAAVAVRPADLRQEKVRSALQAEGLHRLPSLRLRGTSAYGLAAPFTRVVQGYQAILEWIAEQLDAVGGAPELPPRTDEEAADEALDRFMQGELRVGTRLGDELEGGELGGD